VHSLSERAFYQEQNLPLPHLSPIERLRCRFAFRHGGKLHRVKCSGSGKDIISMYPKELGLKVFEQEYWWSDAWDGISSGREFDFSRGFFEQFGELYREVPHLSLLNTNCQNAYFTNHTLNSKDCYLLFGAVDNEDVLYGYYIISCRDVVDGLSLHHCELCYDGVSSVRCYNCVSFVDCRDCSDCILVHDCQSSSNCIACVGLRGKNYHILNKEVSKKEYEKYRSSLELGVHGALNELKDQFTELKRRELRLAYHLYNCEDCVGDMTFNSKGCHYTFDCERCEDCSYLAFSQDSIGSFDCCFNGGGGVKFSCQCISTLATDSRFNAVVWHANDTDYSMECHHSEYLFGCVSLKREKYCILNKQYSESEFLELRERIIQHMKHTGEWGNFFPGTLSPFAYNDSVADLYLPLTRSEAEQRGFAWSKEEELSTTPAGIAKPPLSIDNADDSLLEETFLCERSGQPYKITPSELSFYRKMGVPIPRCCPAERHKQRLIHRHHFDLYERNSAISGDPLLTPFSAEVAPSVISAKEFANR